MRTSGASVYRCFDVYGNLLYVGWSTSVEKRIKHHISRTQWGKRIIRHTSTYFECRMQAGAEETRAILEERPYHNVMGNPNRPANPIKYSRNPKFNPDPSKDRKIRKIWLCWHYTEAYKLRRAAEIYGHPIGRGVLFNRYGSMKKPKERSGG